MDVIKGIAGILLLVACWHTDARADKLSWPIACVPGVDCLDDAVFHVTYPDIDIDGKAFNCGAPGYVGHTGTDITVKSVDDGVGVVAAADGEVLWVSGGKYDKCPDSNEPDCNSELRPVAQGSTSGACTDFGTAIEGNQFCLSWGFNAGNFIIIKHDTDAGELLTFYAHLRKGSIVANLGQRVRRGEKIAETGSSGASLTPHLHFGVWKKTANGYILTDPWAGKCGPNFSNSLWLYDPPYRAELAVIKEGSGTGLVTAPETGISCGNTCSSISYPGTVVTLRATPYSGSAFEGWRGPCIADGKTCVVTMEGSVKVSALFKDQAPPSVRSFTVPAYSTALAVPVTDFRAYDNIKVAGFLITDTPTQPSPTSSSWKEDPPSAFKCGTTGSRTLFAWVKDEAGNVSAGLKAETVCGAVSSARSKGEPSGSAGPPQTESVQSDGT